MSHHIPKFSRSVAKKPQTIKNLFLKDLCSLSEHNNIWKYTKKMHLSCKQNLTSHFSWNKFTVLQRNNGQWPILHFSHYCMSNKSSIRQPSLLNLANRILQGICTSYWLLSATTRSLVLNRSYKVIQSPFLLQLKGGNSIHTTNCESSKEKNQHGDKKELNSKKSFRCFLSSNTRELKDSKPQGSRFYQSFLSYLSLCSSSASSL